MKDSVENIGVRYNQNKNRLELIPPEFIDEVGKVFTFGAKKYSVDNWKHLDEDQQKQIMGSLLRHIIEYHKGNKLDDESGLNHLAHAACNIAMMIWFEKQEKEKG